ncbi:MAG: hypothetical protein Q4G23_11940, partial [Clostridia bacterium]|nr:hypothetical protein [Clostridia bacterium]
APDAFEARAVQGSVHELERFARSDIARHSDRTSLDSVDEARGSHAIRFKCFDTPNSITIYGSFPLEEAEAM